MTSEIEYQCNNCGHEGINTRAVPDVPELARYTVRLDRSHYDGMVESSAGEYVRYDQAAAMLAEKDVEMERLREALTRITNLDEAMGHELTVNHAFDAVRIAVNALSGKSPS